MLAGDGVAERLLREAISADGYAVQVDAALEKDPDLAPLHENSRWAELLRRLSK